MMRALAERDTRYISGLVFATENPPINFKLPVPTKWQMSERAIALLGLELNMNLIAGLVSISENNFQLRNSEVPLSFLGHQNSWVT